MKAVISTAYPLFTKGVISLEEFGRISSAESVWQMVEVADALYKSGRISSLVHDRLVRSAERGEDAKAKARKKAKMREIDRNVDGSRGHRDVQAGLPSLGKKRP